MGSSSQVAARRRHNAQVQKERGDLRKAARITATVLGLTAGLAGVEHGIFEVLQGNVRPEGLMIPSMGPPCVPEQSWNNCEPAMTVIPDFLITGILAIILGVVVMIWSAFFIQKKHGGLVLIFLSILLLLFGGGIFPPLIGIIAGALGTRINKPLNPEGSRLSGKLSRALVVLWPWSLALYVFWVFGQFALGHFFNDWLLRNGYIIILMVLGTLVLSVITTYAHDTQSATEADSQVSA
jgi:MFS family permease